MTSRDRLSGWGNHPRVPGVETRPEDLITGTRDTPLTRGLARSYGDASLPPPETPRVVATPRADRLISFDPETGVLRAEAGLSLEEMNRLLLPRGWFTPVTPGTQYVTLGGMAAADVHGKNHHVAGTFGRHVRRLTLRLADGEIVSCSRTERPELFTATLGGMGLTGHILEVEVTLERVPSSWIWAETERYRSLDAFLEALESAGTRWPMTVGWIDVLARGEALGRGILHRGRWADPTRDPVPETEPPPGPRLTVPVTPPSGLLNVPAMRAFNTLYWRRHPPWPTRGIVSPRSFFYPLDAVLHWNRLYGPRGFTQYQCVLLKPGARAAVRRLLELLGTLHHLGGATFLCVLKDCGEEGDGLLSFPRPGLSLALDIPVHRDVAKTQELVDRLNRQVISDGGRIYLAKDAFTRREDFEAMEGDRLTRFRALRRRLDPDRRIASALSHRLDL